MATKQSKSKRKVIGHRSAVSGKMVTKEEARRNPRETVRVTRKAK